MSRYARRYVRDPGRPAALAVRAGWGRKSGYVRGSWPFPIVRWPEMAGVIRATRDRAGVDRLTGPELSCFVPEARGWPADIGVIAVLDGAGLFDGDGRLRITDIRAVIAGRLHQAPRLRQVVYRPGPGLGRPLWVDVRRFDIADHVRVRALPATADYADLLRACEEVRQHQLDQSRPLWQLWLLPGLPGGRAGMFFRAHHAIADGPAAVTLLGPLLDHAPAAAPPWRPRPAPAARDLLADNLRWYASALAGTGPYLGHPAAAAARLRRAWPAIREPLAERRTRRTSLNRPIGRARRIAVVRSRLDLVKDAAHGAGGTVNDAVLAAVAGGLRDLLQSRGENVAGLVLRAMVPVSLHDPSLGPAQGNQYGVMVVRFPSASPAPRSGSGRSPHRPRGVRNNPGEHGAPGCPAPRWFSGWQSGWRTVSTSSTCTWPTCPGPHRRCTSRAHASPWRSPWSPCPAT